MKVMSFSFVLPLSLFSFFLCCSRTDLCYRLPCCFCCLPSCFSDRCFRTPFCFCCVFCCCCLFILHQSFALPFESSISLVLFSLSPLSRLMQNGKSPSVCWSLSATAFTFPCVVSLVFFVFLSFCVSVTTRSLPFIPASLSHLTTAHSRCDEFFCQPCFHLFFDFGFDVLVLVNTSEIRSDMFLPQAGH